MNGYIYLILNKFESKFSTIYTFIHVISYYLFLFLLNIIHHIYSDCLWWLFCDPYKTDAIKCWAN